jgi:hypothetical protein
LDTPNSPEKQSAVLEAALKLLEDSDLQPPALVDYRPKLIED